MTYSVACLPAPTCGLPGARRAWPPARGPAKSVTSDINPREITFCEKLMISGSMCNRFSGEGKLSNGELTAKGLAMTRMMCANPQLNELDNTISEMLKEGAQVDLTANQLTLATAKQTLTYKLADLMN